MGLLAAGKVVLVHFPFSDLSQSKLRPAAVLAEAGRGDWVLCQITSKPYGDARAIEVSRCRPEQWRAPNYKLCAARQALHGQLNPGDGGNRRNTAGQVFRHTRGRRSIDSSNEVNSVFTAAEKKYAALVTSASLGAVTDEGLRL